MRKKVLFEDATMQYNKWVSGQAAREFGSQRMKFKDLVSQNYDTDQSPNNAKADNVLPYQLINAASIIGDLISNTSSAINAFESSLDSPIVKKDESIQAEVKEMLAHLKDSMNCLNNLIKTVNKDANPDSENLKDNEDND
jgi:hypothetical protein